MNAHIKISHQSNLCKFTLLFFGSFSIGCNLTDNATRLAYQLESASEKLALKIGDEVIIHYKTDDSKAPFTVSILPKERIGVSQNGVTSSTTYHRRFVDVPVLQTIKGVGGADILVKTLSVQPGAFTEKIIIVESRKQ